MLGKKKPAKDPNKKPERYDCIYCQFFSVLIVICMEMAKITKNQ